MPTPRAQANYGTIGADLKANGPYAYRRDDGVYVVPISCLKD